MSKQAKPEYESYRLVTLAVDHNGRELKPAKWREMKDKGFVFYPSISRKGLKKIK